MRARKRLDVGVVYFVYIDRDVNSSEQRENGGGNDFVARCTNSLHVDVALWTLSFWRDLLVMVDLPHASIVAMLGTLTSLSSFVARILMPTERSRI